MTLLDPAHRDPVAAGWRLGLETGEACPAGPLFLSGPYAIGEITASDPDLDTQSQSLTYLVRSRGSG
jgi:hypothetical protein